MPFRYVPLLRSKTGEATALTNLSAAEKLRLLPLIHISESPPATFSTNVIAAWNGLSLALDGLFNFSTTNSPQDFTTIFTALGNGGVRIIPSVECDAPAAYVAIIAPVINVYAPGLVVKVAPRQLVNLDAWVAARGWTPANIDLVITAGYIADHDNNLLQDMLLNAITTRLLNANQWRSVTFASSAAPKDHGALNLGRNDVPRLDWQTWNGLRAQVPFSLDYGDYGVGHPDLTEPPGAAMAGATVSVRYTIDNFWIVLKGRRTNGPNGLPMPQQYRAHAIALAADPQFGGLANCWADQRIQQIAGGAPGTGNRTSWASIAANRHLAFITDRLP